MSHVGWHFWSPFLRDQHQIKFVFAYRVCLPLIPEICKRITFASLFALPLPLPFWQDDFDYQTHRTD